MSSLAPTLTKKEFSNWVKGALALLFTMDGLTAFVSKEVSRHHQRLLQLLPTANMINSLPQCTRGKSHGHIVPGPRYLCSRGVCNTLMDGICKDHRFRGPSWKNTDPKKWCTDAFEVAKCYFAPDGYSHTTSVLDTDFNGILSMIINNLSFSKRIQDNLATEPNICSKLKTNDLTIHENDVTEALRDNIRDTFSDEHKELLQKINDHYSTVQTDSVAEIDKIIAERKTELEELANKLKDDITRHAELKKQKIEQYEKTKEKKDFEEKLKDLKEDMITYYQKNESEIPASPLVEEQKVNLDDLYVLPPLWAHDNPHHFGPSNGEKQRRKTTVGQLFLSDETVRYENIYIMANAGFGKTSLSQKLTMTWCKSHSLMEIQTEKSAMKTQTEKFPMQTKTEMSPMETETENSPMETQTEKSPMETQTEKSPMETLTEKSPMETQTEKSPMETQTEKSPMETQTEKCDSSDLAAMKYFDLLFLLRLRDYQNEPQCNLDDLIMQMVKDKMSRNTQYTKEFVQKILHKKKCLIILDGLDEWAHPGHCTRKPEVPHNNHPGNCTVLTTTRSWKIGTIGLSPNHIYRLVEISELDEKTLDLLKKKVIRILNERTLLGKTLQISRKK